MGVGVLVKDYTKGLKDYDPGKLANGTGLGGTSRMMGGIKA